MKHLSNIILIIFCAINAHSQSFEEMKKVILANDSLEKGWAGTRNEMTALKTNHQNKTHNLLNQIKRLQEEKTNTDVANDDLKHSLTALNERVQSLEEKDLQLAQKTDSLILLQTKIKIKKDEFFVLKSETTKSEREALIAGKQSVYDEIVKNYTQTNLNDLIKISTQESVERDLKLAGNNTEAKQKLQALDKYFKAKETLTKKYNEPKVQNAINQLGQIIEGSSMVSNLKEKLSDYEMYTDGFKETIEEIIAEVDGKIMANDSYTKKVKSEETLKRLAEYFYNYPFEFVEYQYLSNIISELLTIRRNDANGNIQELLEKL